MSYTHREYAALASKANSTNRILKIINGELVLEEQPTEEPSYRDQRTNEYPALGEQLDILYHDIADGNFGVKAKRSRFFAIIQDIKNQYPKPVTTEATNPEEHIDENSKENIEENIEVKDNIKPEVAQQTSEIITNNPQEFDHA